MYVVALLAVRTQRGFASYDLIDETPSCMNGNAYYCGTFCACGDNQTQMCADSSGGMKYLERAQLSFMNMALTSPDDFDAEYNGVWRSWTATCTMATRVPMWWDSGLSQAARWHSWEQAMTDGCYCTHDTCDGKEEYFGGFIDVGPRIQSFDVKGNLVFFGENVNSGYGQITRSLMIGWFQSAGHCANIFDDTWNVIGVGYYFGLANDIYAPNGHFWTENFGQVLNPPTHEIVSGSHIESEADTSLVRFFATFYSATSTEPSSSVVYIDDVEYALTLLTGTAAAGTYYVDVDKTDWTSCKAYYFKFGSTRLPESECYRYYTFSIGDCETDYEVTCTPESDDDDEYTCAETTSYYIHYSGGENCSSASNTTRTCKNIASNSVCYTQANELFSSTDWGSASLCSSARPVGCYVTNVDEEADSATWYWNYGFNCEGTTNSQCSENYQCVCYCEDLGWGVRLGKTLLRIRRRALDHLVNRLGTLPPPQVQRLNQPRLRCLPLSLCPRRLCCQAPLRPSLALQQPTATFRRATTTTATIGWPAVHHLAPPVVMMRTRAKSWNLTSAATAAGATAPLPPHLIATIRVMATTVTIGSLPVLHPAPMLVMTRTPVKSWNQSLTATAVVATARLRRLCRR